jgi:hypothetical protein
MKPESEPSGMQNKKAFECSFFKRQMTFEKATIIMRMFPIFSSKSQEKIGNCKANFKTNRVLKLARVGEIMDTR